MLFSTAKSTLLVTLLLGLVLDCSLSLPSNSQSSLSTDPACRKDKQAVVALLLTEQYLDGALVLGYSLRGRKNVADDVDLVLMYIPERMSNKTLCYLRDSAWSLMPVIPITAPPGPAGRSAGRYSEHFTKLLLWNMTDYNSVLYIDLDTVVTGPLHELLDLKIDFGAVLDVSAQGLLMTFNAGVMLVRPNATLFKVLMVDHRNTSNYDIETTDHSYLNYFMKYRYYMLPYEYNVNAALKRHPDVWNVIYPRAKIIHYTVAKPFNRTRDELMVDKEFGDILSTWCNIYEEMFAYEARRGIGVAVCEEPEEIPFVYMTEEDMFSWEQ